MLALMIFDLLTLWLWAVILISCCLAGLEVMLFIAQAIVVYLCLLAAAEFASDQWLALLFLDLLTWYFWAVLLIACLKGGFKIALYIALLLVVAIVLFAVRAGLEVFCFFEAVDLVIDLAASAVDWVRL
ncbi:hypothetical protein F4778DRAFT_746108 [Xylariomycetidae sp. FL2044]|nr:hypothetical protein F4778DRAFT_746108 [Xylariomycetidae sp. FL2044]